MLKSYLWFTIVRLYKSSYRVEAENIFITLNFQLNIKFKTYEYHKGKREGKKKKLLAFNIASEHLEMSSLDKPICAVWYLVLNDYGGCTCRIN